MTNVSLCYMPEASVALSNRAELLAELAEHIETDMQFLGITAVEDMLQKGVPETIALFRQAGMRVWVLTGDKVETAIDIGYSCRLLDQSMHLIKLVNLKTIEEVRPAMEQAIKVIKEGVGAAGGSSTPRDEEGGAAGRRGSRAAGAGGAVQEVGLAIDGFSLTTITSHRELKPLFFDMVMGVEAVICCRVAPKQKAFIVQTVRENAPKLITLAIGDGANDVAMIQEAHVGVGIRGVGRCSYVALLVAMEVADHFSKI